MESEITKLRRDYGHIDRFLNYSEIKQAFIVKKYLLANTTKDSPAYKSIIRNWSDFMSMALQMKYKDDDDDWLILIETTCELILMAFNETHVDIKNLLEKNISDLQLIFIALKLNFGEELDDLYEA